MKKILTILTTFSLVALSGSAVIACNHGSSSSVSIKNIDQEIINNLKNRDYKMDIIINSQVNNVIKDVNGHFFNQYIFDHLKKNYQPEKFHVINIVLEKNRKQEITNQDFTKTNNLKTVVNFQYNHSAVESLFLEINVDKSVDNQIDDILSNYRDYKLKVAKNSTVKQAIEKLQQSEVFKTILEDYPSLLENFNQQDLIINNIQDSSGKNFNDNVFSTCNPELKAQFTYQYRQETENSAVLNIIVLYDDNDIWQEIAQVQKYNVVFDQIENIKDKSKALKQIFQQLTTEYLLSQTSDAFKEQIKSNKINIDSSRLFVSNESYGAEVDNSFFTNSAPGGNEGEKFYVLWSYDKPLPDQAPYKKCDFITVHWTKKIIK